MDESRQWSVPLAHSLAGEDAVTFLLRDDEIQLDGDGVLRSEVASDGAVYVGPPGGLSVAGAHSLAVEPGRDLELHARVRDAEGSVTLWVYAFTPDERHAAGRLRLRRGLRRLAFATPPQSTAISVALRVDGPGRLELGALSLLTRLRAR